MTNTRQRILNSECEVPHHTPQALSALANERERLTAERAAFSRFHKRIADLDVHPPATPLKKPGTGGDMTTPSETSTHSSQLTQVRNAYRETVMSVPHYEDDYDQSLEDHLASEFSPELARALTAADSFTPPLRDGLLASCHQAIDSRQELLSALDHEADALEQTDETLAELAADFDELNQRPLTVWSTDELITGYDQLREVESRCDELAVERQAQLHSQRMPGPKRADEEFNKYLYESLSVTYPVLADIAEFDSLLQTGFQRLERALIHR